MEAMEVDKEGRVLEQRIQCWGRSASGELGIEGGEDKNIKTPTTMTLSPIAGIRVLEIACGKQHSVFLLENGLVYSAGSNELKQLGHDKHDAEPEKLTMLETQSIKQIACGEDFTIVLNSENQLYSFGKNDKGQLGYKSPSSGKPKIIKTFSADRSVKIVQITCGSSHCLALSTNGTVYSWGDNEKCQLGRETAESYSATPSRILALSSLPIYMVAAGGYHSFALTISGTLFSWGSNRFGQLGLGDTNDRIIPAVVTSLRSKFVTYVCCGEEHTAVLTKFGRVFTFGCGVKGQLGHGSVGIEVNPKQVIELSGDLVSQIACGRWHTLALVQISGKIYSFGMNKFSQLGNGRKEQQAVTPTLVLGSWNGNRNEAGSVTNDQLADEDLTDFSVHKIFCGGNQNFVLLEDTRSNIRPPDHRTRYLQERSTIFLDDNLVNDLVKHCNEDTNNDEKKQALDIVSTVFSSPSCLNGSFLQPETHETTGFRNHGLGTAKNNDEETILLVGRAMIKMMSNQPIKEKIVSCAMTLLKNLPWQPPDLEGFRVFLIIPEIAPLLQVDDRNAVITEFGQKILDMKADTQRVLCKWWSMLPASMFSRIATLFKRCVRDVMEGFNSSGLSREKWQCLQSSLLLLQLLNKVNDESNFIIPYEAFYVDIVQQKIDLSMDYRVLKFQPESFCFCKFPFIFDVKGKAQILETDAKLKMTLAVDRTVNDNWEHSLRSMPMMSSPFLVFHVRRGEHLMQDTLRHIDNVRQGGIRNLNETEAHMEFMKPLKIVFEGEQGEDFGGPKKEFFLLLIEELFDKKYGMFREIESSQVVWFNNQSFEEPHMYYLIGVICGLALYNSVIIDVHFPVVLYKKLLNQKLNFADFRSFDPDHARTLEYLLHYEEISEGDVENMIMSSFQIVEESYGETKCIDLVDDGANKVVNAQNRKQFVDLVVDYYLNKSIAKQYDEFYKGFYHVCEKGILSILRPNELKEMISGCEDYDDFMQIKESASYENGFDESHPIIINFWDVLQNFDLDLRKKFLGFLTGSDKIPIQGIKSIQIKIRPMVADHEQLMLPVAQTCFNILLLPLYRTKEIMMERMVFALENFSKGFGLA